MGWNGKWNWNKNRTALDGKGMHIDLEDKKSGPSRRRMREVDQRSLQDVDIKQHRNRVE